MGVGIKQTELMDIPYKRSVLHDKKKGNINMEISTIKMAIFFLFPFAQNRRITTLLPYLLTELTQNAKTGIVSSL